MKRFIALLLFLPLICIAQIPKPKANTYVNDYVDVLTADQVQQLNQRLRHLEDATTVQVAILLVANLPPDLALEDFARTVGNTWKVGVNHNGIVYVAVLNERKQRLEVAERLEGDIPDMIAAQMIDNLRSHLQSQDYYGALNSLITQVASRLGVDIDSPGSSSSPLQDLQPHEVEQEQRTKTEWEKQKERYDSYRPYITAIIVLGAVWFAVWAYRYRKRYVKENTINGIYIGVGSAYYASTHADAGSDYGGGGGFGGFGGGGGGGFGGGGASGSW